MARSSFRFFMKFKKLDKRHTGYDNYKFLIEFRNYESFYECRNWCWETWGPGCEVENVCKLDDKPLWAWQHTEWHTRIYVATDKEANWYKLRWGC